MSTCHYWFFLKSEFSSQKREMVFLRENRICPPMVPR